MILMDNLDELYEIVDKTTKEDELVNDFTKVRVDVAQAKNELHLLHALMESKNLSEKEAMKALGNASASVD
jgi:Na+/phosphate symporter